MECVVYMGKEDTERQALNVFRMELLGAKVVPVETGTMTLKDAVNEALRSWTTNVNDTYYVLGSLFRFNAAPCSFNANELNIRLRNKIIK